MILVSDTSVLIDLERGGLLEAIFGLPHEFAVPDVLYDREMQGKWVGLKSAFGSPRMLVSCCKTISRSAVTAAFCSLDCYLLSVTDVLVRPPGFCRVCVPSVCRISPCALTTAAGIAVVQ
jgi:hypothetical protein